MVGFSGLKGAKKSHQGRYAARSSTVKPGTPYGPARRDEPEQSCCYHPQQFDLVASSLQENGDLRRK
jgi:hypothetical protein